MTECKAPDCSEQADRILPRYCSDVCRNVSLQVAAERISKDGPGVSDLTDERIAEIRERVEENHELLQQKIEERTNDER